LCHGTSDKSDKIHNKLCYKCASGNLALSECPIHMQGTCMDYEKIKPEPEMEPKVQDDGGEVDLQVKGVRIIVA